MQKLGLMSAATLLLAVAACYLLWPACRCRFSTPTRSSC